MSWIFFLLYLLLGYPVIYYHLSFIGPSSVVIYERDVLLSNSGRRSEKGEVDQVATFHSLSVSPIAPSIVFVRVP